MNATLLFLPAVVVAGFAVLFATAALERMIALPVQALRVTSSDDRVVAAVQRAVDSRLSGAFRD